MHTYILSLSLLLILTPQNTNAASVSERGKVSFDPTVNENAVPSKLKTEPRPPSKTISSKLSQGVSNLSKSNKLAEKPKQVSNPGDPKVDKGLGFSLTNLNLALEKLQNLEPSGPKTESKSLAEKVPPLILEGVERKEDNVLMAPRVTEPITPVSVVPSTEASPVQSTIEPGAFTVKMLKIIVDRTTKKEGEKSWLLSKLMSRSAGYLEHPEWYSFLPHDTVANVIEYEEKILRALENVHRELKDFQENSTKLPSDKTIEFGERRSKYCDRKEGIIWQLENSVEFGKLQGDYRFTKLGVGLDAIKAKFDVLCKEDDGLKKLYDNLLTRRAEELEELKKSGKRL